MSDRPLMSGRAPEPVGAYPHAKRAGNFLFLSGVGPRQRGAKDIPGVTLDGGGAGGTGDTGGVVDYDIEVQCRACFDNVRTILEDAGARWENIVDVLVFLTNMKDDFAGFNKVYGEYFAGTPESGQPNPTRTTIEVGSLPTPIAVEVKVVVWVG